MTSRAYRTTTTCIRASLSLTLLCAISLQAACANKSASLHDFQQGWRQGTVLTVVNAREPIHMHVDQDCRISPDAAATQAQRYALVSYSWGGNPNLRSNRLVGIPADAAVSRGDTVRINIASCLTPIAIHAGATAD